VVLVLTSVMQGLTSAASVVQAEVDAFIGEIESTGTAFESMRERNQALLNQLTQRDEANASLTSERLRVRNRMTAYLPAHLFLD